MISYEDFKNSVYKAVTDRQKFIRAGQAAFNYVEQVYGVARTVQFNAGVDCFYNDEKIDEFIDLSYEAYSLLNKCI